MLRPLLSLSLFSFLSVSAVAQTAQLVDVAVGTKSSNPGSFISWNNKLYFIADDTLNDGKMMTYGTSGLTQLFTKTSRGNTGAAVYNSKLYFSGRFDLTTYGEEVYSYDNSGAPQLVDNIMFGSGSSSPSNFFVFDNKLYFTAENFSNGTGRQLYSYDGSNAPSIQFKSNLPTTGSSLSIASKPIVFNNKLYFSGFLGTSLETYTITPGVAGIFPAFTSSIDGMSNGIVVGSDLYFTTIDGDMWKYTGSGNPTKVVDGTTKHVSRINARGMALLNGGLYFNGAGDTSSKPYIYRYDVASGSLSTVASLYFDNTHSRGEEAYGIVNYNGALYMSIPLDNVKGRELYKYDGSNFTLVSDINPGSANSEPMDMTEANGTLYFSAQNTANGRELYKMSSGPGVGIQSVAWDGSVSAYPNPAAGDATLSITVKGSQELSTIVRDASGRVVFGTGNEVVNGRRDISVPMAKLASGQYFYQVADKAGHLLSSGTILKQ
jgi:ELWxxDGT repeat protein